jgi:hypothetical protein
MTKKTNFDASSRELFGGGQRRTAGSVGPLGRHGATSHVRFGVGRGVVGSESCETPDAPCVMTLSRTYVTLKVLRVVAEDLAKAGVGGDAELVAAARRVLAAVDEHGRPGPWPVSSYAPLAMAGAGSRRGVPVRSTCWPVGVMVNRHWSDVGLFACTHQV